MSTGSITPVVVRWTARVWSILSILFVFAFVIGEAGSGRGPTAKEWVGLSLFPIGVCLGLIVGWFREALGGVLALGSLLAFYLWNFLRSGHLARGPFFFLVAAPGLLFLVVSLLSHQGAPRET
jgi:hypothetical protein